ncbi:protein ripply2-like [Syngnathoides biaculeatus]|uniref:protein ripply2-like n=1 Tax=Syngnathoides biaculeatus TaxID=300417 RepID=UPI002ADE37AB|nr:protein ripply2-like [Syngnathoides biaculeatus]XP_061668775.1 protein ripply2-like [Syngnathoides biaculeatus]XP_061668776.1 protein ripply2-like [Syngnathoides biaculeatus]XP_061668778.1 protein ripply2-like [Syngnathoides biaculeatus]XP_061668779.1 protein ripply2-like [Syngnathoides biaculeatus]
MNPRGGFNLSLPHNNDANQQSDVWRPWIRTEATASRAPFNPAETQPKPALFVHPVKLYWPKTKCFDYLYREAEMLLRNYPVQATICPCEDSSSSEDDTEEEEEDDYDDDEEDEGLEMARELN